MLIKFTDSLKGWKKNTVKECMDQKEYQQARILCSHYCELDEKTPHSPYEVSGHEAPWYF